jgi:hypothetical protein
MRKIDEELRDMLQNSNRTHSASFVARLVGIGTRFNRFRVAGSAIDYAVGCSPGGFFYAAGVPSRTLCELWLKQWTEKRNVPVLEAPKGRG